MPVKNDFKKNLKLYYCAVGVIILGYVLLSIGNANSITSLTLGPVVLVVGYLIAMPIALLTGLGKKESESVSSASSDVEASHMRKK